MRNSCLLFDLARLHVGPGQLVGQKVDLVRAALPARAQLLDNLFVAGDRRKHGAVFQRFALVRILAGRLALLGLVAALALGSRGRCSDGGVAMVRTRLRGLGGCAIAVGRGCGQGLGACVLIECIAQHCGEPLREALHHLLVASVRACELEVAVGKPEQGDILRDAFQDWAIAARDSRDQLARSLGCRSLEQCAELLDERGALGQGEPCC